MRKKSPNYLVPVSSSVKLSLKQRISIIAQSRGTNTSSLIRGILENNDLNTIRFLPEKDK